MAYNGNDPAVRRIMQEAKEMMQEKTTDMAARPLTEDIFEWHFAIRGPPDTPFEGTSVLLDLPREHELVHLSVDGMRDKDKKYHNERGSGIEIGMKDSVLLFLLSRCGERKNGNCS